MTCSSYYTVLASGQIGFINQHFIKICSVHLSPSKFVEPRVGLLQRKGHCTPPQKPPLPHSLLEVELGFVSPQTPALLRGEVEEAHLKLRDEKWTGNSRTRTPLEGKAMQAHGSMQKAQEVSYDMDVWFTVRKKQWCKFDS